VAADEHPFANMAGMVADQQAVVLALVEATDGLPGLLRHRVAALLEALGTAEPLTRPSPSGLEPVSQALLRELRGALSPGAVARWELLLHRLGDERPDIGLVTTLDDAFPSNLRRAHDRSPFLFHRGPIAAAAERSIAVVGTRQPSARGLDRARRLAGELAEAGVVIVSGMAAGIDASAHAAALDAGRTTVAVLGHGILHPTYPLEHRELAERIVGSGGCLVSQFWPDQAPTRATFPLRNVTTSGISLGTVVVEAGEHSGARQQARKCIGHGKQLFLLRDLVAEQEWTRRYAGLAGVMVVDGAREIVDRIDSVRRARQPVQLAFD